MQIRHFQPGDESAQAQIYNAAAGQLPSFKPANAEEVARRYRSPTFDPTTRFYAVEQGEIIGYAVFDANGRISYPWTLPGSEAGASSLLAAVLQAMERRGLKEAWAAYRGDWSPVLEGLARHGFQQVRQIVNYVANVDRLPPLPSTAGYEFDRLSREESSDFLALRTGNAATGDPDNLARFYWENPYFGPESVFGLRRQGEKKLLAAGLLVLDDRYADPTKLDAAMPCFRLGALGTEAERHKRVNGMFSGLCDSDETGAIVLAEAARRLRNAGLAHLAAQAPSDRPEWSALLDRYFDRQGSFPIVSRSLG